MCTCIVLWYPIQWRYGVDEIAGEELDSGVMGKEKNWAFVFRVLSRPGLQVTVEFDRDLLYCIEIAREWQLTSFLAYAFAVVKASGEYGGHKCQFFMTDTVRSGRLSGNQNLFLGYIIYGPTFYTNFKILASSVSSSFQWPHGHCTEARLQDCYRALCIAFTLHLSSYGIFSKPKGITYIPVQWMVW